MNNDNIIEESIQKMKAHVMWKDNDQSMLENRLRELMLEVEQAGYTRAIGEARIKLKINQPQKESIEKTIAALRGAHYSNIYVRKDGKDYTFQADYLRELLSLIDTTPTDNNKEDGKPLETALAEATI